MSGNHWRFGTRAGALALWQAEEAKRHYQAVIEGEEVDLVTISTTGDRHPEVDLPSLGVGIFTKELERALLNHEIEVAIHSAKDLPAKLADNLVIAATLPRGSIADVLICREATSLMELPPLSRIGTGSPRRQAQLLRLRPDLQIKPIRGNIGTRLKKLEDGQYDAVILAAAGLMRLCLEERITEILGEDFLPALGQGIIALECREDDLEVRQRLERMNDLLAMTMLLCERQFLATLNAGCHSAVAGHAWRDQSNSLRFKARVLSLNGKNIIEAEDAIHVNETPGELGERIAGIMLQSGAGKLLI